MKSEIKNILKFALRVMMWVIAYLVPFLVVYLNYNYIISTTYFLSANAVSILFDISTLIINQAEHIASLFMAVMVILLLMYIFSKTVRKLSMNHKGFITLISLVFALAVFLSSQEFLLKQSRYGFYHENRRNMDETSRILEDISNGEILIS